MKVATVSMAITAMEYCGKTRVQVTVCSFKQRMYTSTADACTQPTRVASVDDPEYHVNFPFAYLWYAMALSAAVPLLLQHQVFMPLATTRNPD